MRVAVLGKWGLASTRRSLQVLSIASVVSIACHGSSDSGEPTPPDGPVDTLSIVAISPGNGPVDLLWPIVEVQADVPLQPLPIVLGAVRLFEDDLALTPVFTLVGDRRTLTVDAAMLPGQAYVLQLGTTLEGTGGELLATPRSVTFTTRAPRAVDVVPAGTSLRQWIALDALGGRHVLSIDATAGTVAYSTCSASDCRGAGSWQSAVVESGALSPVASGSIALDGQGRVHVTYPIESTTTLRYATCPSNCAVAANWQRADVDTTTNPGLWSAIRSDATGRLHLVYSDWGAGGLRYATCASACTTIADWDSIALPVSLGNVQDVDLAIGGGGMLTAIFSGQEASHAVQVAECVAVCGAPTSWHVGTLLDSPSATDGNVIVVDSDGARHAAYGDATSQVVYAMCTRECGEASQWQRTTLPVPTGDLSPGIASVGSRLAIVTGAARLATCRVDCTVAANWRSKALNTSSTWNHPRMAMSAGGQPVIVTGSAGAQYLE